MHFLVANATEGSLCHPHIKAVSGSPKSEVIRVTKTPEKKNLFSALKTTKTVNISLQILWFPYPSMASCVHVLYKIKFGKKPQQCINQVPHEMEEQVPGDEHLQETQKENASQEHKEDACTVLTSHGQPKVWESSCAHQSETAFNLLPALLNCSLPVSAWQFDRDCIPE